MYSRVASNDCIFFSVNIYSCNRIGDSNILLKIKDWEFLKQELQFSVNCVGIKLLLPKSMLKKDINEKISVLKQSSRLDSDFDTFQPETEYRVMCFQNVQFL